MSEHPGDTATNRFRAFWAGLLAFVSFGAVLWLALQVAGPHQAVEVGRTERAAERGQFLAEIEAAQTAVLAPDAVTQALPATLEKLKTKQAAKTDLVVPGSPTFLKQSQAAPAPATPAPAPATPAPAPATPAPAPATPAPAPATPAPAPATPAPAPATPAPAPATPAPAPATPAPAPATPAPAPATPAPAPATPAPAPATPAPAPAK
jgi:hypothetical protein